MDGMLRQLRINELRARISLYEAEHSALLSELRTTGTSNKRRATIYRRRRRLKFELTQAMNDIAWLNAEERLQRPDRFCQLSYLVH